MDAKRHDIIIDANYTWKRALIANDGRFNDCAVTLKLVNPDGTTALEGTVNEYTNADGNKCFTLMFKQAEIAALIADCADLKNLGYSWRLSYVDASNEPFGILKGGVQIVG